VANYLPHLRGRQPVAIIGNQGDFPGSQPWTAPLVLPENPRAIVRASILPRTCVCRNVGLRPHKVIENHFVPWNGWWCRWCRRFRGDLEAIEQHTDSQIVIDLCCFGSA
jgi:hypothetical protein